MLGLKKKPPLNKLMVETDSPYHSIVNKRIGSPNDIGMIIKHIASIRNEAVEIIHDATLENVKKFFNFK